MKGHPALVACTKVVRRGRKAERRERSVEPVRVLKPADSLCALSVHSANSAYRLSFAPPHHHPQTPKDPNETTPSRRPNQHRGWGQFRVDVCFG